MKRLIPILALMLLLLLPSWARSEGMLTAAANPQQAITVLSQSGIPFIKASSGTMGDNGAISGMTALPRTFSNGAYLWLPAGAVAAGVPASASWYWFVGSSTTAGTVYNSTYTSGTPRIGTLTAFATTGPGAYTGSTSATTAVSITVPANSMGRDGRVDINYAWSQNGTGGGKTFLVYFGGQIIFNAGLAAQTSATGTAWVQNRGLTNVQSQGSLYSHSSAAAVGVVGADLGVATTADVTMSINLTTAVATDHMIVEQYRAEIRRAN